MGGEGEDEELLLETEAPEEPETPEDEDEISLTLGEEEPEDAAEETPVIKRLRTELREKSRRVRELEQVSQTTKIKVDRGPEPTMEDTDVDWDADKFKSKYDTWLRQGIEAEQAEKTEKAAKERADADWQAKLVDYEKAKAKLAVPGKEEAEEEALSKLSQIQQAIIVKHPQNAALMIALGKFPKRLAALSGIKDNVDFTYAVSDMARELKVTARRKAPEPEGIVKGSAPLSGVTAQKDKQKNAILDKMAAGGDISKLRAQLKALG